MLIPLHKFANPRRAQLRRTVILCRLWRAVVLVMRPYPTHKETAR